MLAFIVYMLTGEAEYWWTSTKSIVEERGEPMTWEAFRGKFLSKYSQTTFDMPRRWNSSN